jgi:hypothetical protein
MEFRGFRTRFSIKTLLNNAVFKHKYINDCQKYKEFNNNRQFDCIDKRRYLDLGIDSTKLNIVSVTKNKHQPGENLRAYFEYQNSRFFKEKDGYYTKDVVDVGPSNRLNINGVARLLIAPYCDLSDFTRHNKLNEGKSVIITSKFEEFVQKNEQLINDWDIIYNFTDVLYYIDLKVSYFKNNGIVGCGTMHIFKYNGELRFDKSFGSIKKENDELIMIADGNMSYYKHSSKYESLINHDALCIDKQGDRKLYINKEQYADCGATAYIRFSLIITTIDYLPRKIDMSVDDNIKHIIIGSEPFDTEIITWEDKLTKISVDLEVMDKVRSIYNYLVKHGKEPTKMEIYRRITIECLRLKRSEIIFVIEVLFKQDEIVKQKLE